jgi:hypothetical protein
VRRRAHPEQALHLAAAQYLRLALRPPTVWSTFPAGGGGRVRGAILKAAGMAAGWPDLLVLHPAPVGMIGGIAAIVVGLELKAGKGRASPAQVAMAAQFEAANAAYEFCWSLEDIQHALRTNGIPLHATVAANGSLWPRRAA